MHPKHKAEIGLLLAVGSSGQDCYAPLGASSSSRPI